MCLYESLFGGDGGIELRLRRCLANWQLRCCVARTGFSSSTTLGEKNKRPHEGAFDFSGGGVSLMRRMLFVSTAVSRPDTAPRTGRMLERAGFYGQYRLR